MQQNVMHAPAQYDPNQLLDALIAHLNLKNDAALSNALNVARPVLAAIRQRSTGVGAWLLLRMSEISNLSIADLRRIMGDQRARMRVATSRIRHQT